MNLAADISAVFDAITGRKPAFAPTGRQNDVVTSHAFVGSRLPGMNYAALPGVQGTGAMQGVSETTDDYITVIGTTNNNTVPPQLGEVEWQPYTESTGAPSVQGPFGKPLDNNTNQLIVMNNNGRAVPLISRAKLARVYEWCAVWYEFTNINSYGTAGIRFWLGDKQKSAFLPIAWYGAHNVTGADPNDIMRVMKAISTEGMGAGSPPAQFNITFDSFEIAASPGSIVAMGCVVGAGNTRFDPLNINL